MGENNGYISEYRSTAERFFWKLDKLSDAVASVAEALKFDTNQDFVNSLYKAVMKIDGFGELELEAAFDYLAQNKITARSFLAKNLSGRKRWLTKFQGEVDVSSGEKPEA